MMHTVLAKIDQMLPFKTASAHCDIPCKIYDPSGAQIAVLSIIRFMDLIAEIESKQSLTVADHAQLIRLVSEKELHATKVKDEVRTIWGDYFKAPQFERYPDTNQLVHDILLAASACKQHIGRDNGIKLLTLVNEFAASFWSTKGVEIYTAQCPYPPEVQVVYPRLA